MVVYGNLTKSKLVIENNDFRWTKKKIEGLMMPGWLSEITDE